MPSLTIPSLAVLLSISALAHGAAHNVRRHEHVKRVDPVVQQWLACMTQNAKSAPEQCSALDPGGSIAAANPWSGATGSTTTGQNAPASQTSVSTTATSSRTSSTASRPAATSPPASGNGGSGWTAVELKPHNYFGGNAVPCEIDTDYLAYFSDAPSCNSMCYEIQPPEGNSFVVLNQDSPSGGHDISYWALVAHFTGGAAPAAGYVNASYRVAPDQSACDKLLKGNKLSLSTSCAASSGDGQVPGGCPAGTWAGDMMQFVNVPQPELLGDPVYGSLDVCDYKDNMFTTCGDTPYAAPGDTSPSMPKLEGCSYINWGSIDATATSIVGTATPGGSVYTTVPTPKY